MKTLIQLEKLIKGKMGAIKRNELTPATSGIGILLNRLKSPDEPSFEMFIKEYKTIIQ